MGLQVRMFLLVAALFGLLYIFMVGVSAYLGYTNFIVYAIIAFVFVGLQYLISPALVGWSMKVKYVTEKEEPELHRMVAELAEKAGIPKPKVGISALPIPNAFAFGRTRGDARVCVTEGILRLLNKDELRAVLGHEISHVKHRDMAVITLLSVVPMIAYYIAFALLFSGGRNRSGGYTALIAIGGFVVYFLSNLLVLYASRVREYYADQGAVKIGNQPHHLASALYKLVYGTAKVPKETLRKAEGVRAFFVNDPSVAWNQLRELKQVDTDMSGSIDAGELMAVRNKKINISSGDKMMEMFSTHPNMLKRIRHLSTLS